MANGVPPQPIMPTTTILPTPVLPAQNEQEKIKSELEKVQTSEQVIKEKHEEALRTKQVAEAAKARLSMAALPQHARTKQFRQMSRLESATFGKEVGKLGQQLSELTVLGEKQTKDVESYNIKAEQFNKDAKAALDSLPVAPIVEDVSKAKEVYNKGYMAKEDYESYTKVAGENQKAKEFNEEAVKVISELSTTPIYIDVPKAKAAYDAGYITETAYDEYSTTALKNEEAKKFNEEAQIALGKLSSTPVSIDVAAAKAAVNAGYMAKEDFDAYTKIAEANEKAQEFGKTLETIAAGKDIIHTVNITSSQVKYKGNDVIRYHGTTDAGGSYSNEYISGDFLVGHGDIESNALASARSKFGINENDKVYIDGKLVQDTNLTPAEWKIAKDVSSGYLSYMDAVKQNLQARRAEAMANFGGTFSPAMLALATAPIGTDVSSLLKAGKKEVEQLALKKQMLESPTAQWGDMEKGIYTVTFGKLEEVAAGKGKIDTTAYDEKYKEISKLVNLKVPTGFSITPEYAAYKSEQEAKALQAKLEEVKTPSLEPIFKLDVSGKMKMPDWKFTDSIIGLKAQDEVKVAQMGMIPDPSKIWGAITSIPSKVVGAVEYMDKSVIGRLREIDKIKQTSSYDLLKITSIPSEPKLIKGEGYVIHPKYGLMVPKESMAPKPSILDITVGTAKKTYETIGAGVEHIDKTVISGLRDFDKISTIIKPEEYDISKLTGKIPIKEIKLLTLGESYVIDPKYGLMVPKEQAKIKGLGDIPELIAYKTGRTGEVTYKQQMETTEGIKSIKDYWTTKYLYEPNVIFQEMVAKSMGKFGLVSPEQRADIMKSVPGLESFTQFGGGIIKGVASIPLFGAQLAVGGEMLIDQPGAITKLAPVGAAIMAGSVVTGFKEKPAETLGTFVGQALIFEGISGLKAPTIKVKDAAYSFSPQDILLGKFKVKSGKKMVVDEPGRGAITEYDIKDLSPDILEIKLKDVPSQIAEKNIQEILGGKETTFAQVSPGGAQPFKTNILTGESSMVVKEILGGSPGRIFGGETGFYGAPSEVGKMVKYSPEAISKASETGAQKSTSILLPEITGINKKIVEVVKKEGGTIGGSIAQKTLYPTARAFHDVDVITKHPKQLAQKIVSALGEDKYKIEIGTKGKYHITDIATGEHVSDIVPEALFLKSSYNIFKSKEVEGVKVIDPESLLNIKMSTVERIGSGTESGISSMIKAAKDIEFETGGVVKSSDILKPSFKEGSPQAYIYYAGLTEKPSIFDVFSGKAQVGSGGRPTISISQKLKVDVFPKELLEKSVTKAEIKTIENDLAKLRAGKFEGMEEIGGITFADIEAGIRNRGTLEQWAKMRRLTEYMKKHPGSYSSVGALTGIRGEFEILQSVGVKNVLVPKTTRGKLGKYLGFGDEPIEVGGHMFEVQYFETQKPTLLPTKLKPKPVSKSIKQTLQKREIYDQPEVVPVLQPKVPDWMSHVVDKVYASEKSKLPVYETSRLVPKAMVLSSLGRISERKVISKKPVSTHKAPSFTKYLEIKPSTEIYPSVIKRAPKSILPSSKGVVQSEIMYSLPSFLSAPKLFKSISPKQELIESILSLKEVPISSFKSPVSSVSPYASLTSYSSPTSYKLPVSVISTQSSTTKKPPETSKKLKTGKETKKEKKESKEKYKAKKKTREFALVDPGALLNIKFTDIKQMQKYKLF